MPARLRTPEEQQQLLTVSRDQLLDFHAAHGRWPLPADTEEQPDDLPPRHLGELLEGGWQRVWDEVGAGPMPKGRGAANYRIQNGFRHVAPKTGDLKVEAPEPEPEQENETVDIVDPAAYEALPGDEPTNVNVTTEFARLAAAFEYAESEVIRAKGTLEAAVEVRAETVRQLAAHPLMASIREEL